MTVLILTKLKAFADEKFIVAWNEMMISVLDRLENFVEKGENASYQCYLHDFLNVFRSLRLEVFKSQDCVL